MGKFKRFVDDNALKELFLHGRKFTWSNVRETPTLTKIDRAFVSVDWELDHPECLLQALSTEHSDHCPLHLALEERMHARRRFRFEKFWVKMDGVLDVFKEAWLCDPNITNPFLRLYIMLRNTARALATWGQKEIGNIKLQIAIANIVILRFDYAQESHILTEEERWLRRTLKQLKGKEEAFYKAYKDLLGKDGARDFTLDLEGLDVRAIDLSDQDRVFSEDEIWAVIKDMPSDKAPRPDGFIGIFFQKAWEKVDLVAAVHKFFLGNGRGFGRLNQALITLIPKTPEACAVFDFRPICLVHSMPKIASKLLTVRIRPRMGELV
ncbi:uncharacterized protein [Aegilops tauschii subsp. strangulata]|uniref:uncharacterized protein n=1 Tax=Aegilops tauschii subsp. strangulata TaxID=200361 RepID=UPI003CC887FE